MKTWATLIFGITASWYFLDLNSSSSLEGKFSPALLTIFLILLAIEIVLLIGQNSGKGDGGGDGGGYFGDGRDCGGDGGGS